MSINSPQTGYRKSERDHRFLFRSLQPSTYLD